MNSQILYNFHKYILCGITAKEKNSSVVFIPVKLKKVTKFMKNVPIEAFFVDMSGSFSRLKK